MHTNYIADAAKELHTKVQRLRNKSHSLCINQPEEVSKDVRDLNKENESLFFEVFAR